MVKSLAPVPKTRGSRGRKEEGWIGLSVLSIGDPEPRVCCESRMAHRGSRIGHGQCSKGLLQTRKLETVAVEGSKLAIGL